MTAPPGALAHARAIVARLKAMPTDIDVLLEFANLDALPPDVVLKVLEPWVGPAPVPVPPLRLRSRAMVEDADVLDLGPVVEAQLRFAGKSFDGVDMEPEERLDGELEGSFAGTLRYQTLVAADSDSDAEPLFELVRFHENCGTVFRAGTAEPVAALADGVVETRDKALRHALEEVLADAPVEDAPPEDAPPEDAPVEDAPPAKAKPKVRAATKATKAVKAPKASATKAAKKTSAAKATKTSTAKATKTSTAKATKKTSTPKTGAAKTKSTRRSGG